MRNSKEILAKSSFVALIALWSMLSGARVALAADSVSVKKNTDSNQTAKEDEKPRFFCTGIFPKKDNATEFCPEGSHVVEVIDFWDHSIRGFGCDCTDLDPGAI